MEEEEEEGGGDENHTLYLLLSLRCRRFVYSQQSEKAIIRPFFHDGAIDGAMEGYTNGRTDRHAKMRRLTLRHSTDLFVEQNIDFCPFSM